MGFFKDFKEDFADAVDEMIPGGNVEKPMEGSDMVNTLDQDVDVDSELSKLDGLLQQVTDKIDRDDSNKATVSEVKPATIAYEEKAVKKVEEKRVMDTMNNVETMPSNAPQASDENAVITSGMSITGDLESTGSISVEGTINGNVTCYGKLTVTGTINGNSSSAEFFADSAKIEGEVSTNGTAKIGVGSVVIGNITATSAVIAGAVKGDIDVQGPVVVDTSAVVMGNIKSRSVQINNGAVIEGFCSQAYAEVDVASVFNK